MKRLYNGSITYFIIVVAMMIKVIESVILQTTKSKSALNDGMLTKICLGVPSQCFELLYETGISFVIIEKSAPRKGVFNKAYNKYLSTTSLTPKPLFYEIPFNLGKIYGMESIDSLEISDSNPSSINSFSFLMAYDSSAEYNDLEGILGLSSYCIQGDIEFNSRFSVIQYAYNAKIITRRIFAHKYINETNGLLYLGEVPHSGSGAEYHKVIGKDHSTLLTKWHCPLYAITFSNNDTFTIDMRRNKKGYSNVAFSTGSMEIRFPSIEGDALFSYLFSLNSKSCWFKLEGFGNKYQKLLCRIDIDIKTYPDVNFILDDDYRLVLHHNDLFVLNNESLYYACVVILEKGIDYISLGAKVLKNYNMIFDYDDNSISFSYWNGQNSQNSLQKGSIISMNIILNCVILLLPMLLFGIIFVLFIRRKWLI